MSCSSSLEKPGADKDLNEGQEAVTMQCLFQCWAVLARLPGSSGENSPSIPRMSIVCGGEREGGGATMAGQIRLITFSSDDPFLGLGNLLPVSWLVKRDLKPNASTLTND